jgi:protein-tyrosine-phosphatase
VCRGNIIRSPFAAALLEKRSAERGLGVGVDSAGTHAVMGRVVDPRAARVAAELGAELNGHLAQPLTTEMLESADAVFVMDYVNEAEVRTRFRQANNKTFLLGAACRRRGSQLIAIDDPDRGTIDDIRTTYDSISECVEYLADRLAAG